MSFLSHAPHKNRSSSRGQGGFTLVEVVMASMVLLFAITGSIVVMQSGFRAVDNARNTTLASQIIQSEMERIRLLNWGDVDSLPATDEIDLDTIFPSETTTNSLRSRFTAVRTCADVPGKIDEMKTITITVTWTGIDGLPHTRSTTGNYAKNGLYDYYYTLAGS